MALANPEQFSLPVLKEQLEWRMEWDGMGFNYHTHWSLRLFRQNYVDYVSLNKQVSGCPMLKTCHCKHIPHSQRCQHIDSDLTLDHCVECMYTLYTGKIEWMRASEWDSFKYFDIKIFSEVSATPFQSENESQENPKSFLPNFDKYHLEKFRPFSYSQSPIPIA